MMASYQGKKYTELESETLLFVLAVLRLDVSALSQSSRKYASTQPPLLPALLHFLGVYQPFELELGLPRLHFMETGTFVAQRKKVQSRIVTSRHHTARRPFVRGSSPHH